MNRRTAVPAWVATRERILVNSWRLMALGELKASLIPRRPAQIFSGSVRGLLVGAQITGDASRCVLRRSILNQPRAMDLATIGRSLTTTLLLTTTRWNPTSEFSARGRTFRALRTVCFFRRRNRA